MIDHTSATYEVEANNVIVALLGVEFDGESTGASSFVGELMPEGDGGGTDKDGRLLSNGGKEVGFLSGEVSVSSYRMRKKLEHLSVG